MRKELQEKGIAGKKNRLTEASAVVNKGSHIKLRDSMNPQANRTLGFNLGSLFYVVDLRSSNSTKRIIDDGN